MEWVDFMAEWIGELSKVMVLSRNQFVVCV